MNLSTELSRNEIINDLKHYYSVDIFNNMNDNDLMEFFINHVKHNLDEIEIGELFNEENINESFLIDTPDGIQKIGEKIKKDEKECFKILTHDNKSISCSYDHKIESTVGWIYAKDISSENYILTKDGPRKVKSKIKLKNQEVFDFEILHDNHRYWGGDGISSHNTGKTYLSLITALHLLKTEPQYRKIVLIKSIQQIQGENPGFLPGTLEEKMEPYMHSFTGNLDKIFGDKSIRKSLMADGTISIQPIAYIRGNTIDNAIIIIDESQNLNMHGFKTIITRIGKSSKMLFLGDIEQIDLQKPKESCLDKVFKGFQPTDFVGTLKFENEDCVRNSIIPKVLEILNQIE